MSEIRPPDFDARVWALGSLANIVLVLVPPLVMGGGPWLDGRLLLFAGWLGAATTFEARAAETVLRLDARGEPGTRWLPQAIGLALLAVLWAAVADRADGPPLFDWVPEALGSLFMATGIALRVAAIRALGRWFTNEVRTLAGQPLITDGPYAHLRHPSEAGTLALAFGATVLLRSQTALVLLALILLPLVLWRIRLEDRLLAELHGDTYHAWARRVPRLLP